MEVVQAHENFPETNEKSLEAVLKHLKIPLNPPEITTNLPQANRNTPKSLETSSNTLKFDLNSIKHAGTFNDSKTGLISGSRNTKKNNQNNLAFFFRISFAYCVRTSSLVFLLEIHLDLGIESFDYPKKAIINSCSSFC